MRSALLVAGLATLLPVRDSGYRLYVASESGDIVSQIAFDGREVRVVKVVPVGVMPADADGPHHVALAPDGRWT